jgi:hypothetical protein
VSVVTGHHGGCYRTSPGDLIVPDTIDTIVIVQVATLEERGLARSQGIALDALRNGGVTLDRHVGNYLQQGDTPLHDVDTTRAPTSQP